MSDQIKTRGPTDEYRDGWERIWGRPEVKLPTQAEYAALQYRRGYKDAIAGHSPSLLGGPYFEGYQNGRIEIGEPLPEWRGQDIFTDYPIITDKTIEALDKLPQAPDDDYFGDQPFRVILASD